MPRDHQTLARRVGALLTEEGLWRPGMLMMPAAVRVLSVDGEGPDQRVVLSNSVCWSTPDGWPHLDDEATGGLLFQALGPGWGAHHFDESTPKDRAWAVYRQGYQWFQDGAETSRGPTLGHAAAGAMGRDDPC